MKRFDRNLLLVLLFDEEVGICCSSSCCSSGSCIDCWLSAIMGAGLIDCMSWLRTLERSAEGSVEGGALKSVPSWRASAVSAGGF